MRYVHGNINDLFKLRRAIDSINKRIFIPKFGVPAHMVTPLVVANLEIKDVTKEQREKFGDKRNSLEFMFEGESLGFFETNVHPKHFIRKS